MFRFMAFGFCSKLSIFLALVFISPSSAALGQCVKNHLDVKYPDGIGRIRTYDCRSGGATMRVAFHRIDEEVVGSLILKNPGPEVLSTLGKFRLIQNPVADDLADLFKRFGEQYDIAGGYSVSLSVPQGGTEYSGDSGDRPDGLKPSRVFSLAPSGAMSRHADNFPFPTKLLGQEIFAKVKAAYAGGPSYDSPERAPNATEARALTDYFEKMCSVQNDCKAKKYLDLARHVGSREFLRISADVGQCEAGEDPTGYLTPRQLIFDLAIIENTSNTEIAIDDVIGSGSIQPTKIAPGGRIGISLKMIFAASETKPIAYGNRLNLRGLKVNGRRMIFEQMSANFMSVTSGDSGASCPYLYALNSDGSVQQSYGKVIHAAHNRYRKMTEVVQLREFTTLFKLREEEPERSFIDKVQLRLRMKDKSYLRFAPTTPSLAENDSDYAEIAPFTAIQIAFELPKWIKKEDVERATLAITGYYRRVHLPPIEVSSTTRPSE